MSITDLIQKKPYVAWLLFGLTVVIVFVIGIFAASIVERRSEAIQKFQVVKEIAEWEPRNEVWGENFPRQFERYIKTADGDFASKHGGSAMRDMLQINPKLVVLWAGYAFSRDYNQGRGHYQAITDVRNSLRIGVPQPATCWTCKSTDVPRLMNQMGVENFYKAKITDLGHEVTNAIGCQDCHDPKTMDLRITRPALIEAFSAMGKDINKSSHQDMRSLVCAQCHVEYYFKGEGKYLTFPWKNGFTVEEMEKYYDEIEHVDFVHSISKAPILKAQHPDYEVYLMGIHGQRNVSCADCHMPYMSEGGIKFTDHHIQSPLNNISRSCQVCHRESEESLRKNVYERQDKMYELMHEAEDALVKAHFEAKAAWDNGATEEQMKTVLQLIRHAQWRWDYVAASHGAAFHAPLESARVLGTAIRKAETARLELARILTKQNVPQPITLPDISTKEKAQQVIKLDMEKLRNEKKEFLSTVVSTWDKKK